ncbi:MAG: DUF87 domain-containing protein, partial [Planctomycetota bacterium]|nr:DUF87 domain-containing protein [Planctomycetota bacterium]
MKIDDVFRKLRPVMGPKLDLLWQEYVVSDASVRREIERVLRIELAQRLDETFESSQVLLKPPPAALVAGDYPAGQVYYAQEPQYPFGIREEEFIQHIGIFGRSGSGKTNLAYLLVLDLIRAGKPFLVFDWKRNYRDLLSLPECGDLVVLTVGRNVAPFHFNPLIPPPGTQATVWLKKLIEIMCHAYFLGEGVTVLLMRAIDSLYRRFGVYDGAPVRMPTLADVRNFLLERKTKGREAGWMESAMRAVEVLCFGEMGRVLNSEAPFDVADLLNRQVVLELDALTNADKTFLIESLLLWIHHYRMGQPDREEFKHAVFIEEAHHILLRKKQEATGEETVTDVILREIRELGEAIICLDQHPSLISKPALGNTYTTFAFNLKHRGDLAMMQDCLLLNSEQTDYLGRLEVGWAVAKLQGRWFWPFLVRLPLVKIDKGRVSDQTIRERANLLPTPSPLEPSRRETHSAPIPASAADSGQDATQDDIKITIPKKEKGDEGMMGDECAIRLTTQERKFLMDVQERPTSFVVDRYCRLALPARKGTAIQRALIDRRLIESASISLRGGSGKILALTEEGRQALGLPNAASNRNGGPVHTYWKRRLAEHLKSCGYEVTEEYPIGGGKTIDLVASRGNERIAFEIETGESDAAANVQKCLEAEMRTVFVVATSTSRRDSLARRLMSCPNTTVVTGSETLERFVTA